jgi:nucleoside-diphosphate-sugar epimerase
MARVLIAGCGYTGIALGTQLATEGHAVWGLRRRPGLLPATIHPLKADLCDPGSLALILPKLDFVFYTAAAKTRMMLPYQAAYVIGIRNLLGHLFENHQPSKRFSSPPAQPCTHKQAASGWMKTSETVPRSFPDEGSWKERALL